MITLSDQLFISLSLPEDARLSNLDIEGATIKVETKSEYLSRVDFLSRYLGQEVDFLSPAGTYGVNDFIAKINAQEIVSNKYCFEDGTANEYFVPCTCCGTGDGTGGDVYQAGDSIFTGDNIHEGSEIFNELTVISGDSPISWTVVVTPDGNLEFVNSSDHSVTFTEDGGITTESYITTAGIIIDGPPGVVMSDGTVRYDFLIDHSEEDPIFNSWYNNGDFQVDWSQIVNAPDCECSGGCDFTEQECINIRDLLANPGTGGSIDCTGLLHNDLDGLQGGDPVTGLSEFYHLDQEQYNFVADLVTNGSGTTTLHSELSDVTNNYSHSEIDTHIDDPSLHFTMEDVNENEIDPIYTAEKNALTPTYITMRGNTTLVDSPIYIDEYAMHLEGLPIWGNHGNSNTSYGDGTGQFYDTLAANNVAIGALAGTFTSDHVTGNEFPTFGIYIGNSVYPSANNNDNETIIGNNINGHGSDTVTIGNTDVTDNYFNGNLIITDTFKGEKVEYGNVNIYITNDEDGNMIFKDGVVEREYTLTELLGGAGGGWNLAANNEESVPIVLDNTVSFNGDDDIKVERVDKNINVSLLPTGVTANTYASPNLTIDENGRIIAAEDAAGCQQDVAQLGTHSTDTTVILDLDNYPHGVITLDSTAAVTIDFRHVVNGDTGHIEVNHQGAESLVFSNTLAPDKLIHIAENSRLATNTVKLSPIAATDVVAYWVAIDKIHLAVIYNTLN